MHYSGRRCLVFLSRNRPVDNTDFWGRPHLQKPKFQSIHNFCIFVLHSRLYKATVAVWHEGEAKGNKKKQIKHTPDKLLTVTIQQCVCLSYNKRVSDKSTTESLRSALARLRNRTGPSIPSSSSPPKSSSPSPIPPASTDNTHNVSKPLKNI